MVEKSVHEIEGVIMKSLQLILASIHKLQGMRERVKAGHALNEHELTNIKRKVITQVTEDVRSHCQHMESVGSLMQKADALKNIMTESQMTFFKRASITPTNDIENILSDSINLRMT
jgi:hypothetical protein